MRDKSIIQICSVPNCYRTNESNFYYNSSVGKNYCTKHYQQLKKFGKILERTMHSKNEIVIHEEYAEIVLYNKYCVEVNRALISLDKIDKVKDFKWNFSSSNGYVTSNAGKNQLLLHRVIMNPIKENVVDHINGNTLDNRNENLRECTYCENTQNSCMKSNNTSGIIGVWFNKISNKWSAEIYCNGKKYCLGTYKNKEDAINARLDAEIKYHGEYSFSKRSECI